MRASINQYVLKIHSRCNLACDHCYVYEHRDQSWRAKNTVIGLEVVRAAAQRIAEHCRERSVRHLVMVLHGGEPLLVGHRHMHAILTVLREVLDPVARLDLQLQTNGIRLDEEFCQIFTEFGVTVGVSLDGDRAANDRHRLYRNRSSSHTQTLAALALLRKPEHARLYGGILCTVDVRNDPVAVYEALIAERPPSVDLLLPHGTWDDPPFRPDGNPTPYAEWLGTFHERWHRDGIERMPVWLFDSLSARSRGAPAFTEALGGGPVALLTIETDGSWEQADSLKTAFDGAPATGMNVFTHQVSEVMEHPEVAARLAGDGSLSQECRACPVVSLCGGGMYAHRYRSGSGFDNPSAYCDDLKSFITWTVPHAARPIGAGTKREVAPVRALAPQGGDDWSGLIDAHRDITREKVAALARHFSLRPLGRMAADTWDLLLELAVERPDAVSRAFDHPYVRSWAEHCQMSAPGEARDLDLAHIASITAAAAVHAGIETELQVPVRGGRVHLPGLGSFTTGGVDGSAEAVRTSASRPELLSGDAVWHPLVLPDNAPPGTVLDDDDPFRVRPRPTSLPAWKRAFWRSRLSVAFAELSRLVPDHFAAMSVGGLRVVTPLERPASVPVPLGAVAAVLPMSPHDLAALLLEQFQRARLTALTNLSPLNGPGTSAWQSGPSPVPATFAATYSFLALAALWRARLDETGDARAAARFSHFSGLAKNGLCALERSSSLTTLGQALLVSMSKGERCQSDTAI